jgi:Uma2 family endonuclease
MDTLPRERMTSDAFLAWAMEQPDGCRYELMGGQVFQMAPERVRHALIKGAVFRRLAEAIETAKLSCQVFPDDMAIEIDVETIYEPDAAVRCGQTLDENAVKYNDPMIVVEVLSPSTRTPDASLKLCDYVRLPSLQHYLIVVPDRRIVIHHHKRAEGDILTRLIGTGAIQLDPPGIQLDVASLFP